MLEFCGGVIIVVVIVLGLIVLAALISTKEPSDEIILEVIPDWKKFVTIQDELQKQLHGIIVPNWLEDALRRLEDEGKVVSRKITVPRSDMKPDKVNWYEEFKSIVEV